MWSFASCAPLHNAAITVWEDAQALEHARQVVASRDKEQGVDRQAVLRQLGVELTRAVYNPTPC